MIYHFGQFQRQPGVKTDNKVSLLFATVDADGGHCNDPELKLTKSDLQNQWSQRGHKVDFLPLLVAMQTSTVSTKTYVTAIWLSEEFLNSLQSISGKLCLKDISLSLSPKPREKQKERKRCCFIFISISVDMASVEPRRWGGSNYHLSAPRFSHSCHLHPKQLVSKSLCYMTHTHSRFLSHTHIKNTLRPTVNQVGVARCFLEVTTHLPFFSHRLLQLSLSNLGEFQSSKELTRGHLCGTCGGSD